MTHKGLSGPAVLQISSYWQPGDAIEIDLLPKDTLKQSLSDAKKNHPKKHLHNLLSQLLPTRLAQTWTQHERDWQRMLAETADKQIHRLFQSLTAWSIKPNGTQGYKRAEVTRGGIDTRELSSRTMESRLNPGLYFIGEVVDVTGWLGGYNFQWAWSSADACAQGLQERRLREQSTQTQS